MEDKDISLNEFLPQPVTQAQSRAAHHFNVQVLLRHASPSSLFVPSTLALWTNTSKVYKACGRRKRVRQSAATGSLNRSILSSGARTDDQRAVMPQMEFHILKDTVCLNPWPKPEERESYLLDAQRYVTKLTEVSGDDVFSTKFLKTMSTPIHLKFRMYSNKLLHLGSLQDFSQSQQLIGEDRIHDGT
jgi:hypothetical protein